MPQLPSGIKVALTTEPVLKEIAKGNFGFNLLAKVNILGSFDAFPEAVTIIYLNDKSDASGETQDYQPGTQSISAGKYQFAKLFLADVGTERCDWSKEDVDFFLKWLATETTQKWLHERHDELVEVLNTTKPIVPDSLKGIFDPDDYDIPPFNTGAPEQEIPDSVINTIEELIKRDNVHSVSFPFNNTQVWRMLIDEQLRRAKATGFPNQRAFTLSGPDGGISCDPTVWGGDVHIPYEGCCMGDLFIKPEWRNLFVEQSEDATLGDYATYWADPKIGQSCHYLLMQEDIGEIACASRRVVGDGWYLYESNRPYVKVNMSGIQGYPRES